MMQLEEITPPDPRLAGWNADDAPVAMRCLACAVEPKQASSLIRELHDALPASSGGVAHVKRVKKGDDGKLRVVLAAEAVYDDVSSKDAYQALLTRRSELAREALEVVSVPAQPPVTRAHFEQGARLWPLARPPASDRTASPTHDDVLSEARQRLEAAERDRVQLSSLRAPGTTPKCAGGGAVLYDPLTGCEALAAADELRQLIDERTPPNHPLLHAPMLVVRAQARRQRRKRSHGAPPTEAYLCTGMDVYMTDEPCVMCAMALLHSRVRRAVYRRRDSEMGGLGSVESVHALSSTNHRFRARVARRRGRRGLRVCVVLFLGASMACESTSPPESSSTSRGPAMPPRTPHISAPRLGEQRWATRRASPRALCGPARGRASGWPRPKPLRPVRRRGCPGICPAQRA